MNSAGKPKEGAATGLLMSVIRTLSASEDLKQREVEKARLEKAYRECDGKLDTLITDKYETLTKTIQAYSNISGRIKTSRERIKGLKMDLESCKELLHCRRDDLRKLWLEGIEQKHVLGLLDQIEEVNNVPQKLMNYLSNKHYLYATELVTKTVAQLEGDLKGVEALGELRLEMFNNKEILHQDLIKELNQHLYERSAITFQPTLVRGSSIRSSGGHDIPMPSKNKPTLLELANSARRAAIRAQNSKSLIFTEPEELETYVKPIREHLNEDPYENPEHYMAILVESLSLLKRIPEAVEAIKSDVGKELNKIVQRTTAEVAENAKTRGENVTQHNQPKLLLELLEILFERFRCVAVAHMSVLGALQRVSSGSDVQLYTMNEIWSNIQEVLQCLLNNYLDVRNMTTQAREATSAFNNETPTDISVYFKRGRHAKQRNVPLFRFEHSSHAISMTNYIREQKQEFYGQDGLVQTEEEAGEETQMVCKPSVKNITLVFKPLSHFINDIEVAMEKPDGAHCTLHQFISDYVKEIFLDHLLIQIDNEIQAATKASEAVKALIDGQTQKGLGAERPLLHNTYMVERSVYNLKQLMMDLPAYADQFLNMICNILQEYKETCQATYRGLVQPDAEDKRIVSASWVKDDGINQCIRLLPNWANLQEQNKPSKDSKEPTPETIEDIRERNSKESELLVINLGDKILQDHEVLCDVSALKLLANLHESLEWFASRVRSFAALLPSNGFNALTVSGTTPLEIPAVDDSLLHSLISQAKDFKDLADTCLLVLHLELRLHCFYFLLPVAKHSSFFTSVDSVDPDINVVKLNKDLTALEDALTVSLLPHKFKYVFEGLGHLISFILINSAQYIKRINENGIKKMCRNIFMLQQNLTNITMSRETDLDHARSFYELLYKNADEILNSIVEQGASFKELEYRNAVLLLQRSSSGFDQKQKQKQLKKLEEIMMEAV